MQQIKLDSKNQELDISYSKTNYTYIFIKRCFDLISSFCGIIILSPILIIISILIKLDSKGKIIFAHNRLGQAGKIIKVYKFRTMRENAEELLKELSPEQKKEFEENFKLEEDPRITKLGDFLRRSSLDELPQLLNILMGNMSVVGPRPIVEEELEKYDRYAYKLLSVKPGLTGNWQANGRSDTTYEERVQLDMDYIDNKTFWMDIKIIFKTFGAVIRKEGAK